MRIQVWAHPKIGDGRADLLLTRLRTNGIGVAELRLADVYFVHQVPDLTHSHAQRLFCDPVAQQINIDEDTSPEFFDEEWSHVVEVTYRPGVANPVATSIRDALTAEFGALPEEASIQTATQYFVRCDDDSDPAVVAEALHNSLIQKSTLITREGWDAGERPPERYPTVSPGRVPPVELIDIAPFSNEMLEQISRDRLLALDLNEMQAIRRYYADQAVQSQRESLGLSVQATDVELELLAQTWSEHCKHKIFAAHITYEEEGSTPEEIDGLFSTYIKRTTNLVGKPDFVKSVFHDNAGVVRFDDEWLLCIKAETHNSPSALDPYGGAITGIVGVNRDILGTGKIARPIFNTDVLCFGYPATKASELPEGLLPPRVILEGVHRGIVDGGNQSGIPVVAGAFLFDASYTGKPLVFCGTGGLLPASLEGEPAWIKHIDAGDLAVMVGGRIGKDGIHGATFSSLALDESSPTTAVQIGEPITQKKMTEFLLEARDAGLIKGVTDNGAGGLSSSLGEMAEESGGVYIDLDACPLKYPGLAAWEILVSESQERMSLAIDPEKKRALEALADKHGVEMSVVGRFTDDGSITVSHQGKTVASLSLAFVHNGVPQMQLRARWKTPVRPVPTATPDAEVDLRGLLLRLLSDPNIGSKEHLIRQYDHEVQGGSITKPFCGPDAQGPTDGGVIRPIHTGTRGVTITHGICPRYGDQDTYSMAVAAVDEAMRAHVALGGDPNQLAALDNFCWPDPVQSEKTPDGEYKLAQLVRACRGLSDACTAYGVPLVSGKDSMKNDAVMGGRKVSIRPTLLVTATGICPDTRKSTTTEFKNDGDLIYLVGTDRPVFAGSALEQLSRDATVGFPADHDCYKALHTDLHANMELYRKVSGLIGSGALTSIHDLSEGGLAVAAAESALGGRLGASMEIPAAALAKTSSAAALPLFGESTGRFLVSIPPNRQNEIEATLGAAATLVGRVTTDQTLAISVGSERLSWTLSELDAAWNAFASAMGAPTHSRSAAKHESVPATKDAVGQPAGAERTSRQKPRVCLITGLGINADRELAAAFEVAGASVEAVHASQLLSHSVSLRGYGVVAVPGGFSYGDHVGSGMMLAHRLQALRGDFDRHVEQGGLVIGICNGFQVLVKMGILPNTDGTWTRSASLVHNSGGTFEDSWVTVGRNPDCKSPWLTGVSRIDLPIRHGEGRFVTGSDEVITTLRDSGQIALRYVERNPNGSQDDVAGIVDPTGRILGLMPHPEAFLVPENHPHWRDNSRPGRDTEVGLILFENAVRWALEAV